VIRRDTEDGMTVTIEAFQTTAYVVTMVDDDSGHVVALRRFLSQLDAQAYAEALIPKPDKRAGT
jgi:hypothetical protein